MWLSLSQLFVSYQKIMIKHRLIGISAPVYKMSKLCIKCLLVSLICSYNKTEYKKIGHSSHPCALNILDLFLPPLFSCISLPSIWTKCSVLLTDNILGSWFHKILRCCTFCGWNDIWVLTTPLFFHTHSLLKNLGDAIWEFSIDEDTPVYNHLPVQAWLHLPLDFTALG